MKAVSVWVLSCLLFAGSAFAAQDRPELVQIASVDGKIVWITKDVLHDTYFQVFGNPKPKMSPWVRAKLVEKIREDAYNWAYSSNGLNLSVAEARAFAEDMASRENLVESFEGYKVAYQFAYSSSGINLSVAEAREVAQKFSRLENPKEMFEVFQAAYRHAYSPSGMNLSSHEALKYALKSVELN